MLAGRPVYYHAPLYRLVAQHPAIDFTAFFASDVGARRPVHLAGAAANFGGSPLGGFKSVFLGGSAGAIPSGFWSLRNPEIVSKLARGRFDVLWLHGYNTATHLLALLTQRCVGGPILLRDEQNLLSPRARWKTSVKKRVLPLLFRGVSGLYIGTENKAWLMQWGIPDTKLFFTPYTVDNERWQHEATQFAPQRVALRQQFGIDDPTCPVILSLGRLVEQKQPLALLEAFRRVRRRHKCALLIVGAGDLEVVLRREIARKQVPDVHLTGFLPQEQVGAAYAAADIFALFSISEPWGLVTNEAMNFSLPVVLSDRVGAASDLAIEGRSGFVVPHDDIAELAEALGALVSSPTLRRQLGAGARDVVSSWTYYEAARGVIAATASAVGDKRWAVAVGRTAPS
jgi:glycosyltransferase involved in cell wall biosynthesis